MSDETPRTVGLCTIVSTPSKMKAHAALLSVTLTTPITMRWIQPAWLGTAPRKTKKALKKAWRGKPLTATERVRIGRFQ